MLRSIFKISLALLGVFILLEMSYRAVVIGPRALNPFWASSYANLISTQYIKPGATPDLYYELKPGLDEVLRGVPLKTNSSGLADKEYTVEKPADTYRIAVVGSSWTMPASVPMEDAYHWQLEEQLNAVPDGKNVEVINFAVENYGIGEILATVREKVLDYEPDMIIFALTTFTGNIVWYDYDAPMTVSQDELKMNSLVLMQLGITGKDESAGMVRPFISEADQEWRYRQQIAAGMLEYKKLTEGTDIDTVVLWLGFRKPFWHLANFLFHLPRTHGHDVIFGSDLLAERAAESGEQLKFKVSQYDLHPDAEGHAVIAEAVMNYLATVPELAEQARSVSGAESEAVSGGGTG